MELSIYVRTGREREEKGGGRGYFVSRLSLLSLWVGVLLAYDFKSEHRNSHSTAAAFVECLSMKNDG